MTHIKSSLWLMLSVSLLVGCSRKLTLAPAPVPPPRTIELEEIDFDYLHGKARMVLKDEKNEREVKAHIRVRKDSVIWMTLDRKSTRLNSSHIPLSRMPSSA